MKIDNKETVPLIDAAHLSGFNLPIHLVSETPGAAGDLINGKDSKSNNNGNKD